MKLTALELEQFRKFDRPTRLAGMTDGLNLVVGPNEMGKSTLVAALRAVLFERHRSASQLVRSFAPDQVEGAAPRVALTFEQGGEIFRVEKRFLRRQRLRLDLPDGRRLEEEAAAERLQELLGVASGGRRGADPDALGIWSALLVEQGQAFAQAELAEAARATVLGCLEAEIDEVVGGAGARALVAAVDAALEPLVTARATRPRGEYRRLAEDLARADQEVADLEAAAAALETDRSDLEAALERRRALHAAAAERDDPAALAALRGQRDGALERDAQLRAAMAAKALAARALAEASQAMARHQARIEALEQARQALVEAEAATAAASQEAAVVQAALERLEAEVAGLEREQTESLSRRRALERLHGALAEHEATQATLTARATRVELALDAKALARVRIAERRPTRAEQTVEILDPLEIAIEGIGRLIIRPPSGDHERWRARLAEAEQQALGALADLGLIAPPGETDAGAVPGAQLELFEPGRHRLPERAMIQAALGDATRLVDSLAARLAASRPLRDQQARRARAAADAAAAAAARLELARSRLDHAQAELAEAAAPAPELASDQAAELAALVAERTAELAAAQAALDHLQQVDGAPSLAELDRRIAAAEAAIAAAATERASLDATIEGLGSRIHVRAGEALDQRLAEARRKRQELADGHARLQREAEVLLLLRTTLAEAEQAAKARYLEPLARRLQPLLQALLPDALPGLDDALQLQALRRGQRDEPVEQLSAGTREQIAILTRLAFARLLVDRGRPAVVVLDDALVFADDRRIGRMFEILTEVATEVQILILTCREQLFAGLPGTRLRLEPAAPPAAETARGAA